MMMAMTVVTRALCSFHGLAHLIPPTKTCYPQGTDEETEVQYPRANSVEAAWLLQPLSFSVCVCGGGGLP